MKKNLLLIDMITDDRRINYLDEIQAALSDQLPLWHLIHRHLPTEPVTPDDLRAADAILLSGSTKSAYDDFPWKNTCHDVFDAVLEAEKPALATCFSAQFLAFHLGGQVAKNPRGIEFGPIHITLTPDGAPSDLLQPFTRDRHLFATHQDCITALPPNCTLLAHNQNSPVQAFRHRHILATQFHSDLPPSTARRLLSTRKEQYLEKGVVADEQDFEKLYSSLDRVEESHHFLKNWLSSVCG